MISSPLSQFGDRLSQIRQTLPPTVRLIAVTKQISPERMRIAYEAGIRDFGENRIQEAEDKQEQLRDLTDVTWHLIGHLQSNKAAKALELFSWIHSVDSLKLAQRLNQIAESSSEQPKICKPKIFLQVKLLPDPNKFGWSAAELLADLPLLDQCTHLDIVGLMSIPPYGLDSSKTRSVFTQTRDLAEEIRQQTRQHNFRHIQMQELSMGMSDDYLLAIQAGATMIRLGRTLFGDRA